MANYCPDCSTLLGGREKCQHCGWFEGGKKNKNRKVDHRCAFSNNNQRCPLNGTRSDDLRGNGPWYCTFHYKHQNDPFTSAKILDDIIQNSPYKNYKDWRDELVEKNIMYLGVMSEEDKRDTMQYMRELMNKFNKKSDAA